MNLHLTRADVANTTIGALLGPAAALAILEALLRREARR